MDNAIKWNGGKKYEHLFDVCFSISTDKNWDDITAAELAEAIEVRLAQLRNSANEVMEATSLIETIEYDLG